MKKIIMIFGALFVLLLAAILVIPFVVDVDKYRPQIIEMANQNINGKMEMGNLKLSLWGQVRIEIDGVSITDSNGKKALSVNNAYLHIPFSSIFGGSPHVVFKMNQPTIQAVKDKSGKINLLTLAKSSAEKSEDKEKLKGTSSAATKLPALLVNARLDVELNNSMMSYTDASTGLQSKFTDLDVAIHDVSLSRPMNVAISMNVDTKMGSIFNVKGPIQFTANAKPEIVGGKFDHVVLNSKLNLDKLVVQAAGMFEKGPSIPFNVEMAAMVSQKEAKLQNMTARFHTASLSASGAVTNMGEEGKSPIVNMGIKSNSIELKSLVDLVPLLKDFQLTGEAQFNAGVNGPSDKLGYAGSFKIAEFIAQSPKLKSKPRIDATVHFKTDQIEKMIIMMKAPGNDLEIQGSLGSFKQPRLDMSVSSPGLDLDQLINLPPPSKGSKGSAGSATTGKSGGKGGEGAGSGKTDYDAMVAGMKGNEFIKNLSAAIDLNIKQIKIYDVRILEILSKFSMKNLELAVDRSSLKVWGGTITANKKVDLKPKMPTYEFATQIKGLDLAKAMESQLELFKNTLTGKADFAMNGKGQSLNYDQLIERLNVKGNFKVTKAKFATIDVGRMVTEALNNSISSIAQKVPALNGKKIQGVPNTESYYEYIQGNFTVANGRFSAPDFYAKAEPQKGIDLKGNTELGLKELPVNARWEIVDTYNLTHAKDVSGEAQGIQVNSILAEKNGPVKFPVSVGCNLASPCYKYTEVPEYLAKIALNNIGDAVAGKARSEAKKKVEGLIQQAPPAIQQPLQDLGKKLFGN